MPLRFGLTQRNVIDPRLSHLKHWSRAQRERWFTLPNPNVSSGLLCPQPNMTVINRDIVTAHLLPRAARVIRRLVREREAADVLRASQPPKLMRRQRRAGILRCLKNRCRCSRGSWWSADDRAHPMQRAVSRVVRQVRA